eukprot:3627959-Prymnesium_polylepis.1
MATLCGALEQQSGLQALTLSNTTGAEAGATRLAEWLTSGHCALTSLALDGCELRVEGAAALGRALGTPSRCASAAIRTAASRTQTCSQHLSRLLARLPPRLVEPRVLHPARARAGRRAARQAARRVQPAGRARRGGARAGVARQQRAARPLPRHQRARRERRARRRPRARAQLEYRDARRGRQRHRRGGHASHPGGRARAAHADGSRRVGQPPGRR